MIKIRTRVFAYSKEKFRNLAELAEHMGISISQVYRVRAGERNINEKFIIGAIMAYPERTMAELFFFVGD